MQSRGPGNTHREVTYLSWAALPYAYACGCVLANAEDKRLTLVNTYTHSTDQPIAHLQGQHPMTASEPPAKLGADSRGDDDVVCRVEVGRAAAARRRRRGNQTRERKNGTAKCANKEPLIVIIIITAQCYF